MKNRDYYFEKYHREIHSFLSVFGFNYNQTDRFTYWILDILGFKKQK